MERAEAMQRLATCTNEEYLGFLNDKENASWNYAKIILHAHTDYGSPKDSMLTAKEDALARKYINSLRFNKWEPLQDGDTEYYLKDDVSLFQTLKQAVGEDAAFEAMVNRGLIADACDVGLQKDSQYPKYAV